MILIVKRPPCSGGGWGYLGEEAGDEWEPLAPPGRARPIQFRSRGEVPVGEPQRENGRQEVPREAAGKR